MKQLSLSPPGRTRQHPNFGVARLIKPLAIFCVGLAIPVCMSTAAFAQPSLTLWPNPIYLGDTVNVEVIEAPTCNTSENNSANTFWPGVQNLNVNWFSRYTDDNGNLYSYGYATPETADTINVTASDSCYNQSQPTPLTIVQLNNVEIASDPAESPWTTNIADAVNDYVCFVSSLSGDVVTLKLDIMPCVAVAAELVDWTTNVTPFDYNLEAWYPADSVSPLQDVVTAIACSGGTPSGNSTPTPPVGKAMNITGCTVKVNVSQPYSSTDHLTFTDTGINIRLPQASATGTGNYTGSATYYNPLTSAGVSAIVDMNKVEISAKLAPAGVGNVLGNPGFVFTQHVTANLWGTFPQNAPPIPLAAVDPSTAPNQSNLNTFETITAPAQLTPDANDTIFALDAPGLYVVGNGAAGFLGSAKNFQVFVVLNNKNISGNTGWYSYTACQEQVNPPSFVDKGSTTGLGNPALPVTWGGV